MFTVKIFNVGSQKLVDATHTETLGGDSGAYSVLSNCLNTILPHAGVILDASNKIVDSRGFLGGVPGYVNGL